jgi:2-polyprenyl-6-methoxyphenol hydroxylase-like FAD-dependent oxidoreductase
MRLVVIEGAGPIGLLTGFQMFRAGMDITLVNNREVNSIIFIFTWRAVVKFNVY